MKKLLLVLAAMLIAVTWANSVRAAYTPMAGDLIKTDKSAALYIIDDNLKRHLFPTEATFWTWYTGGWSAQKVKRITQDDFDILEPGKNVIARPGANLIMFDNSNKSFANTPGGVLCETRALYGDNWLSRVIKIQSSFETDYVKDNSCIIGSASKLPDGSLIQYAKSTDIYYIDGGKKRKVTADGLKANNFKESSVITNVPTAMTYTTDSKSITAFDYNLGILYALNYSRSQEITSRPDLIVSDVVFPTAKVVANQLIDIKLIIRNTGGNLTSESGLRNIIFTGNDWNTVSVAHPNYPSASSPLQTGQSFEITYTGRFAASGSKNFTAKVDEPSEVVEVSEKNNSYSETITVASN